MARRIGVPSVNETVDALRNHFNRGLGAGGGMQGPGPAGANMVPQRPAMGGATAGVGANPSRVGQPSAKGVGGGLVPNTTPGLLSSAQVRQHNFAIGHAKNLVKTGHMRPEHGQAIIERATAGLDRHAAAKRKQAMASSQPKPFKNFGSLSDPAGGGPEQTGLLSSGGPTGVPGANANTTGMSPLRRSVSGGRSQVPNSNSGFGRRGGPGYGEDF
jgi:hypothetical protein